MQVACEETMRFLLLWKRDLRGRQPSMLLAVVLFIYCYFYYSDYQALPPSTPLRLKVALSSPSRCCISIRFRYFSTPFSLPDGEEASVCSFFPITDCIYSSSPPLPSVLSTPPFAPLTSGSLTRVTSFLILSVKLFFLEMFLDESAFLYPKWFLLLAYSLSSLFLSLLRSISRLTTLLLEPKELALRQRESLPDTQFCWLRSYTMFSFLARGSLASSSSSSEEEEGALGNLYWRFCSQRRQRMLISIIVLALMRSSLRASAGVRAQLRMYLRSRLWRWARSLMTSE